MTTPVAGRMVHSCQVFISVHHLELRAQVLAQVAASVLSPTWSSRASERPVTDMPERSVRSITALTSGGGRCAGDLPGSER